MEAKLENRPQSYDVTVESVGMSWEHAGPLFDRYSVNLTGRLDRRWVACYTRLTSNSEEFARFRLDPGASVVSFTCRSNDGPVQVMAVLKRLEALVENVNRQAASELSDAKSRGDVTLGPGAKRPAGLVGLLRLTRSESSK